MKKKKKKLVKDLILNYHAIEGNQESLYNYSIYKFLIALREKLNIEQKVEMIEEKARKYFNYWLEIGERELT
jgi:hypothetical protein